MIFIFFSLNNKINILLQSKIKFILDYNKQKNL